ncbi:hypothetical protein SAMN05444274_101433 [Mariniphaga anaerophila]|uniref:Uncharacterized protein n=1 Tax=Mariniphaga anaerophila TaxID=1484053 RepID=A0A1M4TQS1_9BACT|nr:hypothetical protein SAMN05444274_101433 [Mariniphaga anaerophila]
MIEKKRGHCCVTCLFFNMVLMVLSRPILNKNEIVTFVKKNVAPVGAVFDVK